MTRPPIEIAASPSPKRTGPGIARHRSEQSVGTPRILLDAVEQRFGKIVFDIAASPENAVCANYWTEADDALSKDWSSLPAGLSWLNPPFSDIAPWAAMCCDSILPDESRHVALLVPASVGSEWWANYVDGYAVVLFLTGRITFVGHDAPYPKDCALCVYGYDGADYECWRWRSA